MGSEVPAPTETRLNSTKPITDESSKTVMIVAERRDAIRIEEVVRGFEDQHEIPDELTVIRRSTKYYGPELILYSEHGGDPTNYRLTAPGPGSFLHLWKAITSHTEARESYSLLAEVKATVLDGSYKNCPDCGEPFKTRRHEQLAAIGRCPYE